MVSRFLLITATVLLLGQSTSAELSTLDDYDSDIADYATFLAMYDDIDEYGDYYSSDVDADLYEAATDLTNAISRQLSTEMVYDLNTETLSSLSEVFTELFSSLRVSDYYSIQPYITESYIEEYSSYYGTTPTITDCTYSTEDLSEPTNNPFQEMDNNEGYGLFREADGQDSDDKVSGYGLGNPPSYLYGIPTVTGTSAASV
ncbi:unnamed protein product [Ambrosiozyma monospora]|uniref:Unnamed protein product n=1 Tax=Ambrosiozyma monospora TaxID=43982 RepID=A0A9W6Z173_AMBMO|nr:unnamed protein product [Ambrosiozyma monospora]